MCLRVFFIPENIPFNILVVSISIETGQRISVVILYIHAHISLNKQNNT